MIIQYTWRNVEGWVNNERKIKDYQITFNSRFKEMQILELKLLNTPTKIIETSKLQFDYNTFAYCGKINFEISCDELISEIRNRKCIDSFVLDKSIDSLNYSYCVKKKYYLEEEI